MLAVQACCAGAHLSELKPHMGVLQVSVVLTAHSCACKLLKLYLASTKAACRVCSAHFQCTFRASAQLQATAALEQ